MRDKTIFANPYADGHEVHEQWIMKMFWQKETRSGQSNSNAIQKSFTLTESIRTKDEWLRTVLAQDRNGCEEWEVYCFTHGLPTRNPGSWLPRADNKVESLACKNNVCMTLREK